MVNVNKNKKTDPQWYLLVPARKAMFLEDFPPDGDRPGVVKTTILPMTDRMIVKAEVYIDKALVAEDWAEVDGIRRIIEYVDQWNNKKKREIRPLEAAVTASIGRALANIGYGTLQVQEMYEEVDDEGHMADAPLSNPVQSQPERPRPITDIPAGSLNTELDVDELVQHYPHVVDWDGLATWVAECGMADKGGVAGGIDEAYVILLRFHRLGNIFDPQADDSTLKAILQGRWETRQ